MKSPKDFSRIAEERQRRAKSQRGKYEKLLSDDLPRNRAIMEDWSETAITCLQSVSSDMIIGLLREFDSPPAVFTLAPMLVSLDIRDKVLSALLSLVRELSYAMHEKEAIRTAILIVPQSMDVEVIGERMVGAPRDLNLVEGPKVLSLARLADGFKSGLVIKSDGCVLGTYRFKSTNSPIDQFLPERYWPASFASQQSCGLLFLFSGNGRVYIFSNGKRILSHKESKWHVHGSDIGIVADRLATAHSLECRLVREVIRVAFHVSDQGQGALMTVGDHKAVLKIYAKKDRGPDVSAMRFHQTPDEELVRLMAQDGATVIASDSSIVAAEGFLRPPVETGAEGEPDKGSRHNTAVAVSAVTRAMCIAVSVDGSVTAYSYGRKVFTA
jgi:hypothetical protein